MALILAALSTCSFLDRQVLALLVPDLSRDLHISDVQFGVLIGPVFIITYNLVLLPAALLVDRWNRKWLISIGAVIWTLTTIASAFAQSYEHLLILRVGVAFGEALLGPAAISLLGDLFAREDRPLPTATYIAGSVVGYMGAPIMGAAVLQLAGQMVGAMGNGTANEAWRLTLIGVGLPGLLLGILLLIVGREPQRSTDDSAGQDGPEKLLAHLRRRGLLYGGAFLGLGLINMVATALAFWGPTHLIRTFGLSQVRTGYLLGTTFLAAGLAGTLILPAIFRNRLRTGRVDQIIPISVVGIILLIAGGTIGGNSASLPVTLTSFAVAIFVLMGVGTLPTLFIQLYTPSHLRGRVSGMLFFLVYLIASGVSPVVVPLIAQGVFHSAAALGKAIALITVISGVAGAGAFIAIQKALRRAESESATIASRVTARSGRQ